MNCLLNPRIEQKAWAGAIEGLSMDCPLKAWIHELLSNTVSMKDVNTGATKKILVEHTS